AVAALDNRIEALAAQRELHGSGPLTVAVDLDSPYLADRAAAMPGVGLDGPRTVSFHAPDARAALRHFRALTWVVGSGREAEWT
ncbi:MAG: hypothetical protein HOV94_07590, partial [Saccharothrix sp.]|nr:hypothetical protein [Saccharothrix sp.]